MPLKLDYTNPDRVVIRDGDTEVFHLHRAIPESAHENIFCLAHAMYRLGEKAGVEAGRSEVRVAICQALGL